MNYFICFVNKKRQQENVRNGIHVDAMSIDECGEKKNRANNETVDKEYENTFKVKT